MYEAKEHWIAYQREKVEAEKLQHEHNKIELFATVSAGSLIAVVAIIAIYVV